MPLSCSLVDPRTPLLLVTERPLAQIQVRQCSQLQSSPFLTSKGKVKVLCVLVEIAKSKELGAKAVPHLQKVRLDMGIIGWLFLVNG